MTKYITAKRLSGGTSLKHIDAVKIQGELGWIARSSIVAHLNNGQQYKVKNSAGPSVHIYDTYYIRSNANSTGRDNLLELPNQ